MARIRTLSKEAGMTFGTIPREQWRLPRWIEASKVLQGDYEKMKLGLDKTALEERHKWRYMSGFLARHALLGGYEFFWRVEPGMEMFCDMADDPMLAMEKNGQLFAWSLSETVRDAGVPGAWSLIKRFKETHPDIIPKANDEAFLEREDEDA
ncbi:alpha 1,2-mannosyltransferase 2.4.1 [Mortierella antarctica]|nr:alpha 1,2-mannosyltransferase 2.4.1 [Mortierella antarctica]